MKHLRAIPLDSLCPTVVDGKPAGCGKGWMVRSTQRACSKKPGLFRWTCLETCDRCGYSRPAYPEYVGIEEDEPASESDTVQTELAFQDSDHDRSN